MNYGYGGGAPGSNEGAYSAPKLEPRNLFEKRVARDKSRLSSYNQLLSQIHTRIYMTSQLPGNPNYLVYSVPPFILGLPAIDLQDCIVYLVYQLRTNGFEVRFTYPNLLYISWKQYEQEYIREQNPIAQAMRPATVATTKKGAGGKRGMGAGSTQTVTFAPDLSRVGGGYAPDLSRVGADLSRIGGTAAPPKSVYDYQPPDGFLNTMQRPTRSTNEGKQTEQILGELWKI